MPAPHHHLGTASHGGVYGVVCQTNTVNGVERISWNTADGVTGVDVLEVDLFTHGLEVLLDAILQENTNVE